MAVPPLARAKRHTQPAAPPLVMHLQVACFCQQLVHLLFQDHQPRKQASGKWGERGDQAHSG